MPGNHHHRQRLNRKGHKKQKQKNSNKSKSPNDYSSSNEYKINNENSINQHNENIDLNRTYDTPTNKTITVNESKILQELYGDSPHDDIPSKTHHHHHLGDGQSASSSKGVLKKQHSTQCQITITSTKQLDLQQTVKNKRQKHRFTESNETSVNAKNYQPYTSKSHSLQTPNMHLLLTARKSFPLTDGSPSMMTSTKQKKNKTNDLMIKTPSDSRAYAIYTPCSKKRPLNISPSPESTTLLSGDDLTNITRSLTSSWTITSQAKRSRRASHQPPDSKICCTPKRLFHDQQEVRASTPITFLDPAKNPSDNGGGNSRHQFTPVATSVVTQTIEKCNKITFTNVSSTHSITEYNEHVKITMSLNYSNNCHKSEQMLISDDFQSKCSRRCSWFNSISSSFHNFVTNLKKKWATITLKRPTSNLISPHHHHQQQQINSNTTTTTTTTHHHSRNNHVTAIGGQHADCYAQIQIMQRTIRDLVIENQKFTAIAEEQNKKIENLTNEVMQLKIKATSTPFGAGGLMFGNCNNCGLSSSTPMMIPPPPPLPSSFGPPIPPPPPPPLPPFSLIKPLSNPLLREKKTGSRQLQRSASIGTDRPAITLEDILSVKLKKTKPANQKEPVEQPKINNVNVSRTKLKQVRLRAKSRARGSRGASPAQHFFDNCKSGTNSLLELLEDSGRNFQVQNLQITANQNQSLN